MIIDTGEPTSLSLWPSGHGRREWTQSLLLTNQLPIAQPSSTTVTPTPAIGPRPDTYFALPVAMGQ